jgi:hypothetical protein
VIDKTVHTVHTDFNGSWVVCNGRAVARCDANERHENRKHASLITKALKAFMSKRKRR